MAKEIINVTDITEYLYCPRKVYLKRIKKIKSPPNKAMILGFLKHKVFDILNKNEPIIVSSIKEKIPEKEISSIYNNHLQTIIREITINYSNMIKAFKIEIPNFQFQISQFLKKDISIRADSIKKFLSLGFFGKDLWRNLKPKYLTEYQILSPELGLKGRIDRIKIGKEIIPYEIKTREEIFESDKIQLAAYSLLLEQEFGKKVSKGILESKNKQEQLTITEELKNKVLETAEKIRNLSEGKFQNNLNKCKNCRLKEKCFEI